jgi:hypothetical protein
VPVSTLQWVLSTSGIPYTESTGSGRKDPMMLVRCRPEHAERFLALDGMNLENGPLSVRRERLPWQVRHESR